MKHILILAVLAQMPTLLASGKLSSKFTKLSNFPGITLTFPINRVQVVTKKIDNNNSYDDIQLITIDSQDVAQTKCRAKVEAVKADLEKLNAHIIGRSRCRLEVTPKQTSYVARLNFLQKPKAEWKPGENPSMGTFIFGLNSQLAAEIDLVGININVPITLAKVELNEDEDEELRVVNKRELAEAKEECAGQVSAVKSLVGASEGQLRFVDEDVKKLDSLCSTPSTTKSGSAFKAEILLKLNPKAQLSTQ